MRLRWLPLALLAVLLPVTPARSTTVEHLELPDVVGRADRIAWGDCVSVRPEWDATHTRIYTRVRLAPREMLKGRFESIVEMKLPGGELDGMAYVIHGMPRFTEGMEAIVAVTAPHPISGLVTPVGLGQGVYVVEHPAGRAAVAVRDTRDVHLVAPGVRGGQDGAVERVDADALLGRLRAEVARQAAPRAGGGR